MILQAAQGQAKVPGLPVALNKASRITYVHMYVKYKYLIVTFVHFFLIAPLKISLIQEM